MSDQPRAPRYDIHAPIEIESGDQVFTGQLENISTSGAAVTGTNLPPIPNDFFVALHTESVEGPKYLRGAKVRNIPNGFALAFEENIPNPESVAANLESFRKNNET